MLDDELSDAPSRSATLYMTRQVIMHAGPGPARDPPAGVDGVRSFDPQGGGWRAISYPLDGADRSIVLLRRRHRHQARPVDPAAPAVLGGELHDPQLQHRAAAQRPLRGGQRQLPGRDLGHRLHRPGQPGDSGLVGPAAATPTQLGGAWSSYWYNNFALESEITKGLNVFRVSDPRLAGVLVLGHLNPQTQEFTIG